MAQTARSAAKPFQKSDLRVLPREGEYVAPAERSDEDLMLAHGQGDEAAFAELLRRHQRGILNYTFRMIQNRHVAEELTQDVFMALVKNGQRYQPTAKFTTYLYTIASNIISKEWLRRKRRPRLFSLHAPWNRGKDENDSFNPIEHVGDKRACVLGSFKRTEVGEAIAEALQELPEHQRQAFILHRMQELPYDEVAAITESPVGTVKSRVVRAERALRPHLAQYREYLGTV